MNYAFRNCFRGRSFLVAAGLLYLLLATSCRQKEAPAVIDPEWGVDSAEHPPLAVEDIRTVLPQAGDVELVELSCTACHSLRYIEMQPQLTHKSWEKVVDKMIHTFGAPVRDSLARNRIIDYLYAIKGKK